MAKADWGLKRVCPSCNTRYYDMKKNPPVCPKCGTVFDPEAQVRTRRGRGAAEKRAAEAAAAEKETDLIVDTGDEAEDDLIEDAEELADDDMDDVIDVEGEEEER